MWEPTQAVRLESGISIGVPRDGPRANWKGFLRLSLVACPVALYPATSEFEKVSFNQINRKTGHRIKYAKVDADTGEEVDNEDIVKGYKVDTDTFIEVTKEELENVALEGAHSGGRLRGRERRGGRANGRYEEGRYGGSGRAVARCD
ncbi:hypothetical protein ABIB75_006826 [Bradyrhizobium sp. GM2.2]